MFLIAYALHPCDLGTMTKKQDRPQYSVIASIRLTKAERDIWLNYADKLGMSGNRFLAKAMVDVINIIDQKPGTPIKLPAFISYCRSVIHGGDTFFKE